MLAAGGHRASADIIEGAGICFIEAQTVRTILQSNHALRLRFLERMARALGDAEDRMFQIAALKADTTSST